MPYYDSKGEQKGMIILNYLASNLLNPIKKIAATSNGNPSLINADGYWIYDSEEPKNNWAFLYEDKMNISFKNCYQEEWKTIKEKDSGQIINKSGDFVFSKSITSRTFKQDHALMWGGFHVIKIFIML